jgi:predicted metal-dependent hydrolase
MRPASPPDPRQLPLFDEGPPADERGNGPSGGMVTSHGRAGTAAPSSAGTVEHAATPTAGPGRLEPAVFRHPQAAREIRLNQHVVSYALKRARRGSIGFIVGIEGLSVNAPRWVGIGDIEAALQEKAGWILRKLHEQQDRARRLQAAKVEWRDGTQIPFLGENVIIVLDDRAVGAVLDTGTDAPQGQINGVARLTLHVGLPEGAAPEQIRDAVQAWLQRQAKRVFEERCRHFAQALGVRYTRLALSSAQTRWGSANADGSIRLNWRLIHFALPTIDYVVTHELAHLREMNHSPRFWDVVRSVLPDYEAARGNLKDDVLPVFD